MTTPPNANNSTPAPDRWKPPFLSLPIHGIIQHQIGLGLAGIESTLLVGPRGVGKTHAVRTLIEPIERQAVGDELAGRKPRRPLFYETGVAQGTKTALTDLYLHITNVSLGKRSKQDWTPTQFLEQIVEKAPDRGIRLIIIDEAHLINAPNIDQLRQLDDIAQHHGSSLRLFLIGHEELTRTVAQTGQLGQRFGTIVNFPPLAADDVTPHLAGLHPDLAAIQQQLSDKDWTKLVKELLGAARASFRRLVLIIENALELARSRGGPMTPRDLRLAIDKLRSTDQR